jgi:hypothetical protein
MSNLNELIKLKNDFIRSCGGYLEITEFDQDLNDMNRAIINEYYEQNPKCCVGNINRYKETDVMMKEYEGEMVYNFEWAFIVSIFDQSLLDLIEKYNSRLPQEKITEFLDMIFDRIKELNGITFFWV